MRKCRIMYMKTVTMEVPVELAKRVLSQFEGQIAEKVRAKEALIAEITQLEEGVKELRSKLKNGSPDVSPRGDNKQRIKDYLSKIADNKGARASEISKATGIGASSTAFTLKHYSKDFVRNDETKLWK